MRIKIVFLCILMLLLIGNNITFGSVQVEEVVVTSSGRTPEEAVVKCLVEAIRQKRGVEIDSLSNIRFALDELFLRKGNEKFYKEKIEDEVIEEIQIHTNGLIDRYQVLSCNQISNNSWKVKVEAFVPVYRKKGNSQKKSTLAVMPIIPRQGLKNTNRIDVSEIARQITQRLTSKLVQTQHYNVLDREYVNEFEKERQLLISGGFPIREMARLEEQMGVDYLLVGTISDIYSSITTQEWYGANTTKCEVYLSLDVRAVEFATRQVHQADMVEVSLERVINLGQSSSMKGQIPGNLISELIDESINELNHGFLDILMPIRVLDIQGSTVYLNQGGTRIQEGERFSIFGPHRTVRDPGSGALVRIEGKKLSIIGVREVMKEYSIANVISGDENNLQIGLKCKRLQ